MEGFLSATPLNKLFRFEECAHSVIPEEDVNTKKKISMIIDDEIVLDDNRNDVIKTLNFSQIRERDLKKAKKASEISNYDLMYKNSKLKRLLECCNPFNNDVTFEGLCISLSC